MSDDNATIETETTETTDTEALDAMGQQVLDSMNIIPRETEDSTDKDEDHAADELPDGTDSGDDSKFTPSETQVQAAKHLKYTDDEIAELDEAGYKAVEAAFKKVRAVEVARAGSHVEGEQDADPAKATLDLPELTDMDEDDWDFDALPKSVNALNAQLRAIHAELDALKGNRSEQTQSQRSEAADQFFADQDKRVFGSMLGEGPTAGFNAYSLEAKNRKAITDEADMLMSAYAEKGSPRSYSDCLEAAMRLLHPDKYSKPKKARSGMRTAPVTARTSKVEGSSDPALDAIGAAIIGASR